VPRRSELSHDIRTHESRAADNQDTHGVYGFSNALCSSSGAIGFTLTGLAGTPATM
jgi:hypothetical protein